MLKSFHIQLLQDEFAKRSQKNQQYSLRSFARDLEVSASWLSEVLSLKKGISTSKAEQVCWALKLSRSETKKFILSVQSVHARIESHRASAQMDLQTALSKNGKSKKLSKEEFNALSHWCYYAILELVELDECQHDEKWLATKLHLPVQEIAKAIDILKKLKLLEVQNGKISAVLQESETSFDIPSEDIKKYHRQLLKKAETALFEQSILQREFLNMTLSFDAEKIAAAKKEIRQFQRAFADKFYPQSGSKNSVYQFSLQFFRLDHQGEQSE